MKNGQRSENFGNLRHDAGLIAKSLFDPTMRELGEAIDKSAKPAGQIGVFSHGGNPHPAVAKGMHRGAASEDVHDLTQNLRKNKADGVNAEDIAKRQLEGR